MKLIRIRYTLTSLSNMTESVSVGLRDPSKETVTNANRETVTRTNTAAHRGLCYVCIIANIYSATDDINGH